MTNESNASATRKLPDRKLLDTIDTLRDTTDKSKRTDAVVSLLKHLSGQQAETEEGLSSDLKYTLSRLIPGLASDKPQARVGFSTALCQLLKAFDNVDTQMVLDIMEERAKSYLSGNSMKKIVGNVAMGKVYCLLALVRSGRLFLDGNEAVSRAVQLFLSTRKKREHLTQQCMCGLSQIIEQVSGKTFQSSVLPHVRPLLEHGWSNCTPDILYLVLSTKRHHPDAVAEILKSHWGDESVVVEDNYTHLADIVLQSSHSDPVLHSVIPEILLCVKEQKLDVVSFWTKTCQPMLQILKGNSFPRKLLGLHIFERLLPMINSKKKMEAILYPDIVSILVKMSSNEQKDVLDQVNSLLGLLTTHVTSSQNAKLQLAVLKSFLRDPDSLGYCNHKQPVLLFLNHIVAQMVPDASRLFKDELIKACTQQQNWVTSSQKDQHLAIVQQWCMGQLITLVAHDNTDHDLQLDILQFLFLRAFCKVKKSDSNIPHCCESKGLLETHQKPVQIFVKTLSKLLSYNPKGHSRLANLNSHLSLLDGLVQYVYTLLKSKDSVELTTELPVKRSQLLEECTRLTEVLATIKKKLSKSETMSDSHAFGLLFIYTALLMFIDFKTAQDSLQDVHVCYQKSQKRRKSVAKDDEPAWIEVITELLLSLMSRGDALLRQVAKIVMSALADQVTPAAVMLIADALQQTSLESEDGMVGVGDDDDDDDEEEDMDDDDDQNDGGDVNGIDEDENSGDDSEDDEDDSSSSESEEEVVADDLRERVKSALGGAADDFDGNSDEDEEGVEFSDSEMFKLDGVLAAAFRSMSKGNKKNKKLSRQQLMNFKVRVLDLAEVLIKKHPTPTVIKHLLLPLLELSGSRKPDQLPRGQSHMSDEHDRDSVALGNAAFNNLMILCKQKVEPDTSESSEDMLDFLKTLMQHSRKVQQPRQVQDVGKACCLVIKSLTDTHTGPSPLKTRAQAGNKHKNNMTTTLSKVQDIVRSALLDMLYHKAGRCPQQLFHFILSRMNTQLWPLTSDLLEATVISQEVKEHAKIQAASILTEMINKNCTTCGDWSEFCKRWRENLSKVIGELEAGTKKMYVQELLAVSLKIHQADSKFELFDANTVGKLEELRSGMNHESKSFLKKLRIGKPNSGKDQQQQQQQQQQTGGKKKKKKQHKKEKKQKTKSEAE